MSHSGRCVTLRHPPFLHFSSAGSSVHPQSNKLSDEQETLAFSGSSWFMHVPITLLKTPNLTLCITSKPREEYDGVHQPHENNETDHLYNKKPLVAGHRCHNQGHGALDVTHAQVRPDSSYKTLLAHGEGKSGR